MVTKTVNTSLAKIDYFSLINNRSTFEAFKIKLAAYKAKMKKEGKPSGITANTYDIFFALLSCLAPTMTDIQEKQPGVNMEAMETGNFFAFIYNKTLVTKINNTKDLKILHISDKTVYNHIQVLLKAGILSNKVNHNKTGDNPKNRGYANPEPKDINPKGRGKVQLFFALDVLKISQSASLLLCHIRKILRQYRLKPLFNTKPNKSILDKGQQGGEVAPTTVGMVSLAKKGKGQERINAPHLQIFGGISSNKKDFITSQLFNLCRSEIYGQHEFNLSIQTSAEQIINKHLEHMAAKVQEYRTEKIKSFQAQKTFQDATPNQQVRKMKGYTKHLPSTEMAAIEIVAHALQKQAKHAIKYKYMSSFGYPPDFLISPNFIKALNYSHDDWRKINNRFFAKNLNFSAYCDELQKIGNQYTIILEQSAENLVYAYSLSYQGFNELKKRLRENKRLTESNKVTLLKTYSSRFKALFIHLSESAKNQIRLANQPKTA